MCANRHAMATCLTRTQLLRCRGADPTRVAEGLVALSGLELTRRRQTLSKTVYHVRVWEREPASWAEYAARAEHREGGIATRTPGVIKCCAGEELRLEVCGVWADYEPPPAPALQLERAATTAGTVALDFDWLPHAYCEVELTGGTKSVAPLCVLSTGPLVRDTRMCAYMKSVFSNLEPDTRYFLRVVGHWQHERLVSDALEVRTRAATSPTLVLVSATDGCADIFMDTDLTLEALDVAVYRLSSPCCLVEEVGVESPDDDWDSFCPRDLDVCASWAWQGRGHHLLLNGLVPCERYGVCVTGHVSGTGRIGTRILAFAQPPRAISLMELLGLGFGDWHALTEAALKKAWHAALRTYHQDKNASVHRQYTDTVIERGSAALERLRAGHRLEASDFVPAALRPPAVEVLLSREERRCAARRASSGEHLTSFQGEDRLNDVRQRLELLLRAPVRLWVGLRSFPEDEDVTCEALFRARAPCRPSDATSPCSSEASTRTPPPSPPAAVCAPELTVHASGATFLQLSVSSSDRLLTYRVAFARSNEAPVSGGLMSGSAVAHFPGLLLDTAYEFTVLHGETGAVLTRLQARTLPPRAPPGLSLEAKETQGAQAAAPKQKRKWLDRVVELVRPIQPQEFVPQDCVAVGSVNTVVLRVPRGWKLTLELRAPCGASWHPLCTHEEGVHLCAVAPLPFGERNFRLRGSRALRWSLDSF